MQDYQTWADTDVYDIENEKVGTVDALYFDDDTTTPTWVTVKSSSFFGSKLHFAPLSGVQKVEDGIKLSVTKDQLKDAPSVEVDEELSEEDESKLYDYYTDVSSDASVDTSDGHDVSGVNTDDAMTRSEEQLHVGKEVVETGRARLRKYIVTEQVQTTVPVSKEVVTLEREPITDENRGDAMDGAELSEEEHEMVLNEERVVISKETVPVERVKLAKSVETENQEVNDSVRKEQIEMENDQ